MDLIDHLQVLSARAEQVGDSLTNEEATKWLLSHPSSVTSDKQWLVTRCEDEI